MSIPGSALPLLLASPAGAGGYEIERSLRFNSADSAYLNRTPSTAGNRKTWTWSGWLKRTKLATQYFFFGGTSSTEAAYLGFASEKLIVGSRVGGGFDTDLVPTMVFRDFSAWYHLVVAYDTTESTASNRVKIYVNGVQVTTFDAATYPGLNTETYINATNLHYLSRHPNGLYFDGYLADVHFIDGQALDPTDFGEFDATTGAWNPIEYTGSYGTNGFHLPFSDNSSASALGTDDSGNGNNWTVNNFSVTAGSGNDSLRDSPTNGNTANDTGAGGEVPGNYCTLNPLDTQSPAPILTNGNLQVTGQSGTTYYVGRCTLLCSSGKFYWEATINSGADSTGFSPSPGLERSDTNLDLGFALGGGGSNGVAYMRNGQKYQNGVLTNYGASHAAGDVIGFALDMDNGTLTCYKNGTSQGQLASGLLGYSWSPSWNVRESTSIIYNFGQRAFAYSAPSGFKALCTANLDDPLIADGRTAMDVLTYTGNGTSQTFSGLEFSPDLVWLKKRSDTQNNVVYDTTRGVTSELVTNSQNVSFNSQGVTAFNSDGFSVGNGGVSNDSAQTYVAWTWDESASKGFDIVSYTGDGNSGRTVSHSLGVKPSLMIVKRYSSGGSNWSVYHQDLGATKYLQLNAINNANTASNQWSNTEPTSTVFTVGSGGNVNDNGDDYIAYLFAEIEGYSKFGSYTGNGNADGPFVHTGFRSSLVIIKETSGNNDWMMYDTARDPSNEVTQLLVPNTSDQESTLTINEIDIVSNGFKLRSDAGKTNNNGDEYAFIAFAENPFKYARAR
jgi:hypothetical protein